MRDIIFRGKRIDNGEWIEGSLVCWPDDDEVDTIVCFNEDGENGELVGEHIEVDHKTVGQFTGSLDKNGKKIFEGDIVSINEYIDYVIFAHGCFCMARQAYCYEFTYQDCDHIKVVGNTYDNPDLLL